MLSNVVAAAVCILWRGVRADNRRGNQRRNRTGISLPAVWKNSTNGRPHFAHRVHILVNFRTLRDVPTNLVAPLTFRHGSRESSRRRRIRAPVGRPGGRWSVGHCVGTEEGQATAGTAVVGALQAEERRARLGGEDRVHRQQVVQVTVARRRLLGRP